MSNIVTLTNRFGLKLYLVTKRIVAVSENPVPTEYPTTVHTDDDSEFLVKETPTEVYMILDLALQNSEPKERG